MGGKPPVFLVIWTVLLSTIRLLTVLGMVWAVAGCGVLNVGKFKGLERTDSDEKYYLLKEVRLVSASSARAKTHFDHTLDQVVNLVFVPANEKNHYVTKSVWYDPSGEEYRTIRQTHGKTDEEANGASRQKGGTTRIHTLPLMPMWRHKPGQWTVELFIDDELARRLEFHVR